MEFPRWNSGNVPSSVSGEFMSYLAKCASLFCGALLFVASVANAQTPNTQTQSQYQGITREQADQILQELRQIRQLLTNNSAAQRPSQATPSPQRGKVNIAGLPVLGRADAPLTIVEFSDYQCPFCRAFHNNTFEALKKNWIDTGKARFISWDVPLSIHSNAAQAAQAARCAGEQNKFWELRSLLVANAAKLATDDILGYSRQVPQLDFEQFKSCVESGKYLERIKKSVAEANGQGITGTPSFIVAKTKGDVADGVVLIGAQPYAEFESQLREQSAK
jgi:protein-disulfide isomerase